MKPRIIFIYILLFFISVNRSFSQISDVSFDQLFLSDGLSQSIVKIIIQDSKGYMYFGTEDGLNKYDAYSFTVFRNTEDENSLSYNDITSLCEDKFGRLWVGTFNSGANLYIPKDNKFIRFNAGPTSLSNNNINVVLADNDGVVWVGTDKGLNQILYSERSKEVKVIHSIQTSSTDTILQNLKINSLLQDSNKSLWVGTDFGLFNLEQKKKAKFYKLAHFSDDLTNSVILSIYQDKGGVVWVGTSAGLNKLEKQQINQSFAITKYFNNTSNSNILNNEINAISEDLNGKVWLGTNGGGIIIFDPLKESYDSYLHDPTDKRSLSSNNITSLYLDRSGIMWIGTYGGGINKVSRGTEQFYHYKHRQNDTRFLSHPIIWSFYEDKNDNLWIGTHNGLDKLDRKSKRYKHFYYSNKKNSISNNVIRVIQASNDGNLLIGTNGGGVNILNPNTEKFLCLIHDENNTNSISNNNIRSIFQDKEDIIWIGTYGGGLNKYNPISGKFKHYKNNSNDPKSISHNYVRSIVEDKKGVLWIGTEGGGLNKFNKRTEVFTRYVFDKNNLNSLSSDYIFSIINESDDHLWLGTYGGGINKFNKKTASCKIFTTENGLSSNSVYGMLKDEMGNFWISTNNGISKFNPKEETFKNFNVNDGLQNNEFNGGAFYKTKKGELFFGGINGFNSFFPKSIKTNFYHPPIEFTSFKVFNKKHTSTESLNSLEKITLSHTENVFSIEFAALDFSSPEKNKYAYKLTGVDKDWVSVDSKQRVASYTTLSPGKYTFCVRASNSDGIWNEEEAKLFIEITPPFWQEYWFIFLVLLFFFAMLYYLYVRRLKVLRMKVELQTAHDAQLSIMPLSDPENEYLEISGSCFPAYEVGGDFFDYFWLDSNKSKFGCMIGDVSGKAMKAAITAIMTSGMIISETKSNCSISNILLNVNEALLEKIEKRMFVSLCICSIDLKKKVLSFANAGMNKPIIISDNRITFLDSNGPRLPLGLVNNVEYLETDYNLKSGDLLILTTDGVSEAQNSKRHLFGSDRLEKHLFSLDINNLSSSEIKNSIINEVEKFTNSEKQSDDLTVLVIRVR